ncbi:MAG: hypothetical protein LBS23_01780, partial [Holosporaceae bacterium]|nr:hypothetical protein [Holosporaceae bacterium]
MVLKTTKCIFLLFALYLTPRLFSLEEDVDLHDFYYKVDMFLEEKKGVFVALTDMIFESEMSAEISQLRTFTQQDKTVSNMKALNNRIKNDITTINKKAHILGFYGAKTSYKIQVENSKNIRVKMYINLGRIFNLKLNIKYLNQDDEFNRKYNSIMQAKLRMFKASIAEIKALVDIAVKDLRRDGFFEPSVTEKRVCIDYKAHSAILNLSIDPGKKVCFSETEIRAFPDISTEFIKNRIVWNEGDFFDIEDLEATAENLKNTQIFSNVKIEPAKDRLIDNKIPMIIELEEDKKH